MSTFKEKFETTRRAVSEDPNNIIRIGTLVKFSNNNTMQQTDLVAPNPKGGVDTVVSGYETIVRKYGTAEEIRASAQSAPLLVTLSRKKPNLIIRKDEGYPEAVLDKFIDILSKCPIMINLNDPTQWDEEMCVPVGTTADRVWYYEVMNKTRDTKMKSMDDIVEIHLVLKEMANDPVALRKAMFMIGESPTGNESEIDMAYIIKSKTSENTTAREQFLNVYVRKDGMSKDDAEIIRLIRRGVSLNKVENRNGVYILGSDRLGMGESEALMTLKANDGILKFLKTTIASVSDLAEDKEEAKEVVKEITGSVDDKEIIEAVMNKVKTTLGKKTPHTMKGFRPMDNPTGESVVDAYNALLKDANLPNPKFITVESVKTELNLTEA